MSQDTSSWVLAWNRRPRALGASNWGHLKNSLHRELKLSPKIFDQHILDMHSAFKKTFKETQQHPFHHWPAGFDKLKTQAARKMRPGYPWENRNCGEKGCMICVIIVFRFKTAQKVSPTSRDSLQVFQTTFFRNICVFVRRFILSFSIKLNLLLLSPTLKLSGSSCDWNHLCWGLISHWFPVVRDCHQPNSSFLRTYPMESLLRAG